MRYAASNLVINDSTLLYDGLSISIMNVYVYKMLMDRFYVQDTSQMIGKILASQLL